MFSGGIERDQWHEMGLKNSVKFTQKNDVARYTLKQAQHQIERKLNHISICLPLHSLISSEDLKRLMMVQISINSIRNNFQISQDNLKEYVEILLVTKR